MFTIFAKMKKIRIVMTFFITFVFSQTEKYNIKDIVEVDGVFYKNFSREIVNGFVFKVDDDISIPLGMIKDGNKDGEWLEWSERDTYQETLELQEIQTVVTSDTVKEIPSKRFNSRETNEYISGESSGKNIMILIASNIVNYDTSGARIEESYSYYDTKGILKNRTYRRYEYEVNNNKGQMEVIRVYNDKNNLIEKQTNAYNKDGNVIEKIYQGPDGSIIQKIFNEYDNSGNLIENNYYGQGGEKLKSMQYFYGYNGNKSVEKITEFIRDSGEYKEITKKFTYINSKNLVTVDDEFYRTYHYYDDNKNLIESAKYLIESGSKSGENYLVAKTLYRFTYY